MAEVNLNGLSDISGDGAETASTDIGTSSENAGEFEALHTSSPEDVPGSPLTAIYHGDSRSSTPDTVVHTPGPARLEALPPEIREKILRQAMREPEGSANQAQAFYTAHNLRRASPQYLQDLVNGPPSLREEFSTLTRNTEHQRSANAMEAVGKPGDKGAANNVLAAHGAMPPRKADMVRLNGATIEMEDNGKSAAEAIRRHGRGSDPNYDSQVKGIEAALRILYGAPRP
jgi:hypothetical protein